MIKGLYWMKDKKKMPALKSKAPKIYQRVIFVHMTTHTTCLLTSRMDWQDKEYQMRVAKRRWNTVFILTNTKTQSGHFFFIKLHIYFKWFYFHHQRHDSLCLNTPNSSKKDQGTKDSKCGEDMTWTWTYSSNDTDDSDNDSDKWLTYEK